MKKLMIFAVTAIALVACTKIYEKEETPQQEIGFGTWNDVMTKAVKTAFGNGDTFDIYGFKWNTGPANQTNVFKVDLFAQALLGWQLRLLHLLCCLPQQPAGFRS